ncbi:hypothetical protein A3B26_02940 [Candidatus Giovannonibacteria bacterium RIFCSPLOWO2_01_FULL_48_47]|nr:MAG: hypothetical protein A3B26_02940 [Candidatus Giovannonibacteria bacterium RIFCSPLOWO2_01_FULL_48_47]OGF96534.1 MAG: hypothetical protein A2613_03215 [Candidatus Giovannonibacteria bacterium RIFOXYD1_FULL_48_21]HBT81860.1 hypothetical protein [Candidatus Giovannonibacteria bacterium]
MKNILKEVFKVAVLGGVLLALQVVAFSEPTQTPPGGNVPAPINVGSAQQTKSGGLTVGSLASLGSAFLATNSGNVGVGTVSPSQKLDVAGYVRGATGLCIGGDCRTSWPGSKAAFVSASSKVSISSASWQDMPDLSLSISTNSSPLFIQAEIGGHYSNDFTYFRFVIDGTPKGAFRVFGGYQSSVSFSWIENVSEGSHNIKVQWYSTVTSCAGGSDCWVNHGISTTRSLAAIGL